uniref:Uncharacterized protein n=1 Tax=viral metagenome TaxID=1070528 RepID=A0A6C0JI28_9ZZZZ
MDFQLPPKREVGATNTTIFLNKTTMDPVIVAPPRRRTCGLCSTQGHDRRHCRAADLYRAAHPEVTDADLDRHRAGIRALVAAGLPPIPPPLPQVRCIMNRDHAHWGDRFQCRNMSTPGGQYCARCDAVRPRPDLPPEQRCRTPRCECIVADHGFCKRHLAQFIMRRKAAYVNTTWLRAIDRMEIDPTQWPQIVQEWADHQPPTELMGPAIWWRHQIRGLRIRLAGEYFIRDLWNQDHPNDPMDVNGIIDWHFNRQRAAAPRHPPGSLAAFVADTQNVHTGVVSNQTHEGMKKLLAIPVKSGQVGRSITFATQVLDLSVQLKWVTAQVSTRILADFNHWYGTRTCRATDDWLYKRIFDGLYTTICQNPKKEVRLELYKRLFEEMKDSLGMCCDGHITRLVNVLVGFDDAFAPELTTAEKVQNLFAALSAKESSLLEKVAEGVRGLRAFGVPEDEWEPWIDAL